MNIICHLSINFEGTSTDEMTEVIDAVLDEETVLQLQRYIWVAPKSQNGSNMEDEALNWDGEIGDIV